MRLGGECQSQVDACESYESYNMYTNSYPCKREIAKELIYTLRSSHFIDVRVLAASLFCSS